MRALIVDVTIEGEPVSKERPRKGKRGRVYTPSRTRASESALGWSIKLAHPTLREDAHGEFKIEAFFLVGDYRRRDQDNMLKLVMDTCNGIVWADDSQVYDDNCEIVRGVPRPATVIRIWRGRDEAFSEAEHLALARGWKGRRA